MSTSLCRTSLPRTLSRPRKNPDRPSWPKETTSFPRPVQPGSNKLFCSGVRHSKRSAKSSASQTGRCCTIASRNLRRSPEHPPNANRSTVNAERQTPSPQAFAISKAQRLWVSITGVISIVTTSPSRTMTLPLITVYLALCGAQKSVAATGSCNAPA